MRLTVVGCSGSLPGPDSAASCYLVEAPAAGEPFRLLLDLGSGALGPLQRMIDPRTVGAVALSHLHPDHCLDLCGFYVLRRHHPGGPWGSIPVYGPPGVADRMATAYGIDPKPGMTEEFDFCEYDGQPFQVGPFTVETVGVDHPVDAYALRLSVGSRTLAYTGDSGPCEALGRIVEGADVLLVEASFRSGADNPEHLHLTGPQAARLAATAGVGRAVLTHVPPWYSPYDILREATPYFPRIEMARPGLVIDL